MKVKFILFAFSLLMLVIIVVTSNITSNSVGASTEGVRLMIT